FLFILFCFIFLKAVIFYKKYFLGPKQPFGVRPRRQPPPLPPVKSATERTHLWCSHFGRRYRGVYDRQIMHKHITEGQVGNRSRQPLIEHWHSQCHWLTHWRFLQNGVFDDSSVFSMRGQACSHACILVSETETVCDTRYASVDGREVWLHRLHMKIFPCGRIVFMIDRCLR